MSKKLIKTNVLRILDKSDIEYKDFQYPVGKEHVDGVSAAILVGKRPDEVYKTLVTQGNSKEYYIFVIPVAENLNMKKAAKACGEKSIEMINFKDLNKITGYIRGGCSPIGMKKLYKTYIDQSIRNLDRVTVSAGKIGYQVELNIEDLIKIVNAEVSDLLL